MIVATNPRAGQIPSDNCLLFTWQFLLGATPLLEREEIWVSFGPLGSVLE